MNSITTGVDGTATSAALLYGNYELREISTIDGYGILQYPIPFRISVNGVTVDVPVSNSLIHGSVCVLKTNSEGIPISDVKFALYDSNDTNFGEQVTAWDGTAVWDSLVKDDYYLVELEAAPGYAPFTEPIPFSITTNNEVVQKTVINSWGNGTLRIIKHGENALEMLSGVVFEVYRVIDNEKFDEIITDNDGIAEITLPLGDYYLLETLTADGYRLPDDVFPFSLTEHNAIVEIIIQNELAPPQTGDLRVSQFCEDTNIPLPDAVFGIYQVLSLSGFSNLNTLSGDTPEGVKVAEITTGNDGIAISGELYPGDYYLEAIQPSPGYMPIMDKTFFSVTAGETTEIALFGSPIKTTGSIQTLKKANGTDTPLKDAVFGVYTADSDIKVAEITTDDDGKALTGELLAGDYYLMETKAPAGYIPITDKIDVTVTVGETTDVIVYNALLPKTGRIQILKKAEGTDTPLKAAVFGVYTADGNIKVAEITTDADGKAVSAELAARDYSLLEIQSPAGDSPISDKIGVTVTAGKIFEHTVYNTLPGQIRVMKRAEDTGLPLSGALFGIYDARNSAKIGEFMTANDGTAVIAIMSEGDYFIQELQPPRGYILNNERFNVTVRAGQTHNITVLNAPDRGYIRITKRDESTGIYLNGAVFGIYNA